MAKIEITQEIKDRIVGNIVMAKDQKTGEHITGLINGRLSKFPCFCAGHIQVEITWTLAYAAAFHDVEILL